MREFAREQDQAIALFLDLDIPSDAYEWFDDAVNCCAFLLWRLNERGTRMRFLTQRFDCSVPEEATVYDVLRYLARVEPERAGKPVLPIDSDIQIAFSSDALRVRDAGWPAARVLGPMDMPAAERSTPPPR